MPLHFIFPTFFAIVLVCCAVAEQVVDSKFRIHADEGHYEFPLTLGRELSMTTGQCVVGSQVYPNCIIKLHAYGVSVHSADNTLSSIPIISFQSNSALIPEPYSISRPVVEQRNGSAASTTTTVKLNSLTIKDLVLPISRDLVDQFTSGTLRAIVNVRTADIQMDSSEYDKLLKYQSSQ